ncbi:MAG TPA: hypothetical protein VFT95_15375 [Micromonosporaceae bacterium]|nr:hypothetical protein [Micromonosporaceae bacterium]
MRTKPGPTTRLLLAGLAAVLTGCATQPQKTGTAPVAVLSVPPDIPEPRLPQPMPAPAPAQRTIDPGPVIGAARAIEPATTLGAVVLDRTTRAELLAIEPDRQFRAASLVKLLIAIDVLSHGADDRLRDRISTMLRVSNDGIASDLWSRAGGPELVRRTSNALGLTGTHPPADPGQWGDVLLTARDVVRVYDHVLTTLPEPDRTLIVGALAGAPRVAADGFDQHFGIPAGLPGQQWAIKQGWSNSARDISLHTSGLVGADWRYVVVVLTEHPRQVAWKVAAKSVTAATQALAAAF